MSPFEVYAQVLPPPVEVVYSGDSEPRALPHLRLRSVSMGPVRYFQVLRSNHFAYASAVALNPTLDEVVEEIPSTVLRHI